MADKLAKMRSHGQSYLADVLGLQVLVLPDVWSPAYDWSGQYFIENLAPVVNRSFLDVGCGTGVISIFAARAGAERVVAVDVNREAVRNCQLNFERFDIVNGEAYVIDSFDAIRGTFDVIVWNAPHHDAAPEGVLDRSCVDEGFRDIRAFFAGIGVHLNVHGSVFFGYSDSGDLSLIEALVAKNGFEVRRKLSDHRQGYNCLIFELGAAC